MKKEKNPIVDALETKNIGLGVEIIVSNLARMYDKEKDRYVPSSSYKISLYIDGKLKPVIVGVDSAEVGFDQAYQKIKGIIEEAKGKGFNLRYSGSETAKEELASRLDMRPEQLPEEDYQARIDSLDVMRLKVLEEQVAGRKV